MLELIGGLMLMVFFCVGAAAAASPWIALVVYLKRKKGTQIVEASEYKPSGPRIDGKDILIAAAALIYIFSPIDLWPEPLGGIFDDLGVLIFAIRHFYNKFWSGKALEERRPVTHHDDAIDVEFEVRRDLAPARRQR